MSSLIATEDFKLDGATKPRGRARGVRRTDEELWTATKAREAALHARITTKALRATPEGKKLARAIGHLRYIHTHHQSERVKAVAKKAADELLAAVERDASDASSEL